MPHPLHCCCNTAEKARFSVVGDVPAQLKLVYKSCVAEGCPWTQSQFSLGYPTLIGYPAIADDTQRAALAAQLRAANSYQAFYVTLNGVQFTCGRGHRAPLVPEQFGETLVLVSTSTLALWPEKSVPTCDTTNINVNTACVDCPPGGHVSTITVPCGSVQNYWPWSRKTASGDWLQMAFGSSVLRVTLPAANVTRDQWEVLSFSALKALMRRPSTGWSVQWTLPALTGTKDYGSPAEFACNGLTPSAAATWYENTGGPSFPLRRLNGQKTEGLVPGAGSNCVWPLHEGFIAACNAGTNVDGTSTVDDYVDWSVGSW